MRFVFTDRRELVLVMSAIGNDISNAVYEANAVGHSKPLPSASRYLFSVFSFFCCHIRLIFNLQLI